MKRLKVIIGPSTTDRLPKVATVLPTRDDALYRAKREITHPKIRDRETAMNRSSGGSPGFRGAIDYLGVIDFEKAEKG